MNKKRSCFIVKDGKGNVRLYYLVDLKTEKDIINLDTSDYSFEDGIDINVFDLYEQNQKLQQQLEEKDTVEEVFTIWLTDKFNKTQDTTFLDVLMKYKKILEKR